MTRGIEEGYIIRQGPGEGAFESRGSPTFPTSLRPPPPIKLLPSSRLNRLLLTVPCAI